MFVSTGTRRHQTGIRLVPSAGTAGTACSAADIAGTAVVTVDTLLLILRDKIYLANPQIINYVCEI